MPVANAQPDTAQIANVYRLLSRLWISEVDAPLLQQFAQQPMRTSWEAITGECVSIEELELESLECDYCHLFVGPKRHLPPVQSVWTQGQFRGDCVASMNKYTSLLTDFTQPSGVERDHLGVQLAVMGTILGAASRLAGDAQERAAFELADAFYRDHLTWTDLLLDLAAERAQSEFYSGMIRVTKELLTQRTP